MEEEKTFELGDGPVLELRERVSLLLFHRDSSKVLVLEAERPQVIGRGPPSQVVIPDQSLSKEHARFELAGGVVTVEDLDSTNGTWVNGARVSRAQVTAADRVRLGRVDVELHVSSTETVEGPLPHDTFHAQLSVDVDRARELGRPGALLMIRSDAQHDRPLGRWHRAVRGMLRPSDRIGAYGPSAGLVWLEGVDQEHAQRTGRTIAELDIEGAHLRVGIALFPSNATSAEELIEVAGQACQTATAGAASTAAPSGSEAPTQDALVLESEVMIELFQTARKVARSSIPILIRGQTGTGKEVLARTIHRASPRRDGRLCSMNCGAIPEQLVESVLFGHVQGAFTGAGDAKPGLFEEASGGTLLLDEIGELSLSAQVALLRVLEEKKVRRVGAPIETPVDVRVIAATHRDLEKMVESGAFREDLFYRLNVMTLEIPPLRDRPQEIPALADAFREAANQAYDCSVSRIEPDALDLLMGHSWPGNVRELRNVIDRAVVIAEGESIRANDLPKRLTEPSSQAGSAGGDLRERVKRYERSMMLDALQKSRWNLKKAAKALNLPYRTLTAKMKSLGIERPREDDS